MTETARDDGCDGIWDELAQCYADLRLSASRVLRENGEVADVVQETCLRVFMACRRLAIRGPVRNYAFGVLRLVILQFLKAGRRLVALEEPDGAVAPESATKFAHLLAQPDADETLDREASLARLGECLARLSPERRSFILEYSAAHGNGARMARSQGVSMNAVNLKAYKIRVSLLRCMEEGSVPGKDSGDWRTTTS